MSKNMELFIYGTYLYNEIDLLAGVKKEIHECPNCLNKVGHDLQKIKSMDGIVVTCVDCNTIMLGVPEKEINKGNAAELKEYGAVHAEWYY